MSRVLVLSPHPDDEAIGCGGTLRKHVLAGDEVHVYFLTSGEAGGHGIAEAGAVREREAERAAAILGVHELEFWRERDGACRARRDLVERLAAKLRDWRPDLVYVPHPGEVHSDHRAALRIVRRALAGTNGNVEIRGFEVWTPLTRMDLVEDITATVDDKIRAIAAYESQCRVLRFDDAFRGLARYRGAMFSWPEGDYAEVFTRIEDS